MGRNPVGDFNTQGQEKCPYCGSYFPEAWIHTHMDKCTNNPANQDDNE